MIIPLTADQIRTFQDTGRVSVEIPLVPQPKPGFTGVATVDSSGASVSHGFHVSRCPVKVGDRVAIGEEWRYKPDKWVALVQYRDLVIADTPTDDQLARMPSDHDNTLWRPADTMPEWAVRLHATVATIVFHRSGDVWVWAVELEADNG